MLGNTKFKKIFYTIAITTLAWKSIYAKKTIEEQCQIVNDILGIEESTESCCKNSRVGCDNTKNNVIQLDLSELNLKRIPRKIVKLPLLALDLSKNPKLRKLPKGIGHLAHLEVLNLSDLPKLAKLPDSITLLKELNILILNNDTSLKTLPENFGNISNLNQLYATSTGLTKLPPTFINMKKLVTANFSSSKNLYGEAPQFDTDILLNFYDTNICYRRGIHYPEKWILPHNKYCETINISPITMGMVNANTSIELDDEDDEDDKDYRCGKDYGICANQGCCSKYGYCGTSDDHCSVENECQTDYGICYDIDMNGNKITVGVGYNNGSKTTKTKTESESKSQPTINENQNVNSSQTGKTPEDYRCGKGYGSCSKGHCCSKHGWCGLTAEFCDPKSCQTEYGTCWNKSSTTVVIKKVPGRCGLQYGNCPEGYCCSKYGWCGSSNSYCSARNCQVGYGKCNKSDSEVVVDDTIIRDDGRCGKGVGRCPTGTCCSKYGWCGNSLAYCGTKEGCQKGYGECINN